MGTYDIPLNRRDTSPLKRSLLYAHAWHFCAQHTIDPILFHPEQSLRNRNYSVPGRALLAPMDIFPTLLILPTKVSTTVLFASIFRSRSCGKRLLCSAAASDWLRKVGGAARAAMEWVSVGAAWVVRARARARECRRRCICVVDLWY